MNNKLIGLITFILISVTISILFHRKIRRPIKGTCYSAFTAAILFQLIAGPDPFLHIAFIRTFGIAFVIALLVGIPFGLSRRKVENTDDGPN
jgi:hypothetical protein